MIGYLLARAFSGVGRLDMLCAGVVMGTRAFSWLLGVLWRGGVRACLAGCAGRCKKARVFGFVKLWGVFLGVRVFGVLFRLTGVGAQYSRGVSVLEVIG